MKGNASKLGSKKKLTPTQTILLSFFLVILSGAILLTLPISNKIENAGFLNNLFVATSATCVTGLVPVVVADQYSLFGQIVIIFLMQIGGLGFMTIVAIFLISSGHKLSVSNRGLMQESLNLVSVSDIGRVLKRIFKYVFVIEGTGLILFATQFVPEYGWAKGLFTSLFTAVSAFCNAGFDNIGPVNLRPYALNPVISLTTSSLIILGGIGYTLWFDIKDKIMPLLQRKVTLRKFYRSLMTHTKLVLIVTTILLSVGTVFILLIEYTNMNTIAGFSFSGKLLVSFFQSTTLRTAGFSTIDFGALRLPTQMVMLILMFIGGSPGGAAGGIKTTTFAVILLAVYSELKGKHATTIFKKRIADELVIKSMALVAISLALLFTSIFICLLFEPFSFMELTFEAVSALATVGLSLNVTPLLSPIGKVVMIVLMYTGRVGVMSVGISLQKKQNIVQNDVVYPQGNVLIG